MRIPLHGTKRTTAAAVLLALALAAPVAAQAADAPPPQTASGHDTDARERSGQRTGEPTLKSYRANGVRTRKQRSAVAATGVSIDTVHERSVVITGDPAQVRAVERLGHELTALSGPPARTRPGERPGAKDFPPQDSGYHNYAEANRAIDGYLEKYPDIMTREVIGRSYEGRDIVAVKISDNAAQDENEPEVLFTHHQHAREHLTVEMALYTLGEFGAKYGSEDRITKMVDERELWIIPDINPDGGEYDIASGSYQMWRKNREPNSGSSAVGTDLNRNWDYKWACCGGSSGNPGSQTYRGPSAESSTEVGVVADFTRSRVVEGQQQITAHIDFHTYSELVLWPYGYTYGDTADGLTQDDRDAFAAIGTSMADSNGYTPQQSSNLYITDGSVNDWMWADQKDFSYTFEMYPGSAGGGGFYPPDEVIGEQTARNKEAVLILLENADCMYRSIGKEQEYCPTG
ncbi:M14 family metallopeptidase [Streptomyces sp. N2-109]|uniref:M14 family metallopeptidase n=1 Tax=Streptomyces gossypii TaxID=2883101 RepID=A0ABT2K2I2_9ACTN|nr:M14 family metallopeptidase [Streptomyces gossypii]MCT2594191.1 M14 family metallopeptidase [Streptomyces gossypii]